jgi:hypothetical protein
MIDVDGPQAGRTVVAGHGTGLSRSPSRQRKVRAPQDAVVGNAHRPKPALRGQPKDRDSATESIPPMAGVPWDVGSGKGETVRALVALK